MFGDEIILRGEAAYQNVKGTFPGNRGYLVGSSLAGKPYPPHGIAAVWTGISWKPEGITPLESTDDLQTYAGVDGGVASVNGVQYTYGAGGWVKAAAGGLTPYADYTTLSAQAPTVGKIAQIPRLCGNGYFALRGNGTRWEVCPGESIVRDAGVGSAGYDLTATGTTYVPLASYTIPAGLIGDGEEWEADCFALFTTFVSGSNTPSVRLATNVITSQNVASSANRTIRNRGAFPRLGTTLQIRNNSATDIYSGGTTDVSVDLGLDQTIDAGISMGAVGNVGRLRQWTFRRIG